MHAALDPIYQAAHREVIHTQLLLERVAGLFHKTFALSADETAALHVHAELHHSGQSVELFVMDADVVFSLGIVFDRQSNDHAWELAAFHGANPMPYWVCTMHIGPTASDYARRVRGARLVAVIGNYLEHVGEHVIEHDNEVHEDACGLVHVENHTVENNTAWLPQIAAYRERQPS